MEIMVQLGQFFHQDVMVLYSGLEEAILAFKSTLSASDIEQFSGYLEDLLLEKSDHDLELIWDDTESDTSMDGENTRRFFEVCLKLFSKE